MSLPILRLRYVVSHESDKREFFTRRNALRYLRRCVASTAATYEFNGVPVRDLGRAMDKARATLASGKLGARARIEAFAGGVLLASARAHVVATYLEPADTAGVDNIDLVVAAVDYLFPKRRYAGVCVCKPSSDHRDCAAVDWFDTWDNMHAAVDYFLAHTEDFSLKYLILGKTIYSAAYGFRPRAYTGATHYHVHVSVTGGIPGAAC